MRRVYFDYAASTPVDLRVYKAMEPYFTHKFGNPGSLHSFGQEAIAAVDASRETIAKAIGADFREIIFTGSATEANNLALRGALAAFRAGHPGVQPKIIVSAIEHESVLDTARAFEQDGVEIVILPVDSRGIVDFKKLKEEIDERTAIVSIIYVNNEIGTVQPIPDISKIIRDFKAKRAYPLFHTDAAQALQFLGCDVHVLGIDLMTLSAHKIYGPKGIGALYIKESEKRGSSALLPVITGGGQEFGLRSGTENVPLIVGFAKAVELLGTHQTKAANCKKLETLRDYFWRKLKKLAPAAEVNGGYDLSIAPHILNVYFPGRKSEEILTAGDLAGLAVSAGSACRSRSADASYVIQSLGHSKARAGSSIRFSFGRWTTKLEIDAALGILKKIV